MLVVSLTGGERGDILNPAMDLPEVHGRIHEIRRDEMARAAEILGVEESAVWLKAKTGEGVGPIGEELAIGAECVVLVERA